MQEKRAATRRSFGVEQIVASTTDGKMPPLEAFAPVRCIDISQTGLAFYHERRPHTPELVVGLGIAPNIVYLVARVVHVEMLELCGNLVFRVGCEFTGQTCANAQTVGTLRASDVDDAFESLADNIPLQA